MLIPVILSGGSGTRLWPLSRELYPKQLLPLVNDATLLQETVLRLDGLAGMGKPLVVCNEHHRFMVAEQLRLIDCPAASILLEPVGRNTAPAAAVAALQAMVEGDDPLLLVLPADHVIRDAEALREEIAGGMPLAEAGRLITFGIVPDKAETGYGYIKRGASLNSGGCRQELVQDTAFEVTEFVEKPDLATAEQFLAEGGYYWNSGMFLFRASRYLEELEQFAPQILTCCRQALQQAEQDLDFVRLDAGAFAACPKDSIDYAVMEKTDTAAVISLDAGWNDVGSWSALWESGEPDADGNVLRGDVLTEDARNCYLHSSGRIVAAVGLEDLVVVETADAVLVAARDRVQNVKDIVARLKAKGRGEALLHRRVNRPWGSYEGIDQSERFQVKRITVNPGASLSLQLHHHRAEHWVVVTGTARITKDGESFTLTENQSTYIPLGVAHRLENPGIIPLELIEVQSGSYLGEDDIVRFEDTFGRD
ncbi:mannose-1-phosphate guanylyltransferase/mannose-6-phosphate isomerase [Syntrophotalea acetylenivorans]|uniref:mannose-1-phosphate guanylyltransferase n=1 Tax=Syntrophotalea acetylenivorans TaxID=1842532 RepID=A0A1L3GLC0_9BACT|nr:mannose-1-phosphate guanylyltransferase/mannose-6-phosphate isomerase [Syntrophotalea acetylenivorans]APG26458.1 mannose-1-phosphate guanylyltransferase/mannose-6-phosphate isomerase [Syntrophotalea acetylenivorans]